MSVKRNSRSSHIFSMVGAGTTGRGYAEPAQALEPFDRAMPAGKLKQTEQGETVANRFGHPDLTAHYLDECFFQALQSVKKSANAPAYTSPKQEKFHLLQARLSAKGSEIFRRLKERETFAKVFQDLTYINTIRTFQVSSRPSQRGNGSGGVTPSELRLKDLRAVPFIKAQNTAGIRLSWYGTGSALAHELQRPGGLEGLSEAYRTQPTFRRTIDQTCVELAKTDLWAIARNADPSDAHAEKFLSDVLDEYHRTDAALKQLFTKLGKLMPGHSDAESKAELYAKAERHLLMEMMYVLKSRDAVYKDPGALQTVLAALIAHNGESG